ncbi:hypothetical protein KUTeg_011469 [Tegillarca granosa]|uniref:Chromatin assembly factor 1 subunit p150 C-terminal domain-containing protein n=1 Tax=Tegillarca granosa TaxID=220873 RepID=A0ABQ9E8F8_TEGGR|nr:hypothetical protein KUTeg_022594 [Tegillarca granosa]KAJ8310978.1 hypothetical protein KUTeg_011469 [Tegillarca granosa]
MPDLIRMVHGNLAGIKKLVKEFRTFWDMKTGLKSVDKVEDISMEVDNDEGEALRKDEPKDDLSNEKSGDTPVSESNTDNFSISKRQMEIKITSIAVREKREGFKKVCWYVNDNVLQQFNLQDLPVPSAWEFVTKPFKTPNKQKTEESPVTPVGRKTPTVSITQFARPMSPSTIAAQNAAIMANLKQQESAKQSETKMETDSEQKDTSKPVINDQRTIKQFTKKFTSPPGLLASSPVSSKQGNKSMIGMLVKPIAHNKPLGASPELRKTMPRRSALSPASSDKKNEGRMSPVTGLQSKSAAFSPVGNNQSKVIVDLSQPNIVTVISPNSKPVSKNVNVIPPSMIRSNLKQSNNKGVTGPKGKTDAITKVCAAESTLSPRRIVPKPCAVTSSSDDSKKQEATSIPIASELKEMGNNASEAIMID